MTDDRSATEPTARPPEPQAPYGDPSSSQWQAPPPPSAPSPPAYAPPYSGYPPYVIAQSPPANGLAIASMVLGIAGLVVLFVIGAILALIFGYIAKGQIDRSGGVQGGRGMAIAGIVMGWIGLVWGLLIVGFYIWFVTFMFSHQAEFFELYRTLPTPRP